MKHKANNVIPPKYLHFILVCYDNHTWLPTACKVKQMPK